MKFSNSKITKVGNEFGITIPLEMLQSAGLKHDDKVQLELIDGVIQISKNKNISMPEGISEDFFDTFKETMETYDQTIKSLVER